MDCHPHSECIEPKSSVLTWQAPLHTPITLHDTCYQPQLVKIVTTAHGAGTGFLHSDRASVDCRCKNFLPRSQLCSIPRLCQKGVIGFAKAMHRASQEEGGKHLAIQHRLPVMVESQWLID